MYVLKLYVIIHSKNKTTKNDYYEIGKDKNNIGVNSEAKVGSHILTEHHGGSERGQPCVGQGWHKRYLYLFLNHTINLKCPKK